MTIVSMTAGMPNDVAFTAMPPFVAYADYQYRQCGGEHQAIDAQQKDGRAVAVFKSSGAEDWIRTRDLLLGKWLAGSGAALSREVSTKMRRLECR